MNEEPVTIIWYDGNRHQAQHGYLTEAAEGTQTFTLVKGNLFSEYADLMFFIDGHLDLTTVHRIEV